MQSQWNQRIRQWHRWLSMSFTLFVIANFAVMGRGEIAQWVGVLTLIPLALLLISGLYLFALPYLAKRKEHKAAGGALPLSDNAAVSAD